MKINFKKIASIIASTVMLGSTIAFAAAAWPAPFVNSGVGDAAIVVGSSAAVAASDSTVAATDIANALNEDVTAGGNTLSGDGDSQLISEKGTNAVTLNPTYDQISEVWATTITDSNLPTLLADGTYQNDENSEFPFTQKINLGTQLNFSHFADSDYDDKTPSLGFKLPGGTYVLNYTLDFTSNPDTDVVSGDWADIETTDLTILGKTYYVLDADNSTQDITLLDAAESVVISEGETKTLTVSGKSYQVSLEYVGSSTTRVNVDGAVSNSLSAGGTQKMSDGAYLGIKDIMQDTRTGGISKVELSIGAGKLELLQSSNTVEINDVSEDNLKAYVYRGTAASGKEKLDKIVITWQLDDEQFLMPDSELEMPGFKAVKFTTTGVVMAAEEETTVTYGSNDYIELKTTIADGDLTLPILYATSGTGNFSGIGKASDELLATASGLTLRYNAASGVNEGFIATWNNSRDFESYYLTASVSRDSTGDRTNRTTIKNKLTSAEVCKDMAPTDTCTIGNVVLTASDVNYTDSSSRSVLFTINAGGSFQKLYTEEGLGIWLPYQAANTSTARGAINLSTGYTGLAGNSWDSFTLWFEEADSDGNLGLGTAFNMTLNNNADKVHVASVGGAGTGLETSSGSKIWEYYVASDLSSKILHDVPGGSSQSEAVITYHGQRVSPSVYIAAPSITSTGANSIQVYTDDEVSSFTNKNIIVVGGSCINAVAAKMLGSDTPMCGDAWVTATTADANKWLIKVAGNPYNTNKIAILAAGYDAAGTIDAAAFVASGEVDASANSETVYPLASA